MRLTSYAIVFILAAPNLGAQAGSAPSPARAAVAGIVRDAKTKLGVPGANVFVLGTLDGGLTDSTGAFSFATAPRTDDTLIVKRLGYRDARRPVGIRPTETLVIELINDVQAIAPVAVQAGRYAAADEAGAVLTPLEIVTIPGTAADINRAIQTLPGVQQVDDGTGLYVRGGDYTETRVYLNDGRLLNPAQLQNPAGTFVGTLDPFLLDAVYFESGGFGARYGDALSAVVELHTQRRPDAYSATLSAGLGAVGFNAAAPGPNGTGLRVVADENDLSPVVRLNGSPRQFSLAPRGGDRTLSAFWNYRPTANMSVFATDQRTRLGTLTALPSVVDTFATSTRDRAAVARWSDLFGPIAPHVVLSSSISDRTDDFGSFRLSTPETLTRLTASVDVVLTERTTLRGGVEVGREHAEVEGSVPASGSDQSASARVRLYRDVSTAHASAWYQELDWRSETRFRVTAGYRYDRSTAALHDTFDPRVNAAFKLSDLVTTTAAWGAYHQAVDPTLQALSDDSTATSSAAALPAMRARQTIVGLQLGDGTPLLRLEAYDKVYRDLAAQDRDFTTVANGVGRARGLDLIARAPVVAGLNARVVYSYVHSVRTDPSSGVVAPAPADVTHGLTVIATRVFGPAITLGATFRYASGRPFTPVLTATKSRFGGTWVPVYAAPGSDRLPAYGRLDLSASVFRVVTPSVQLVGYLAVMNALDRANVFTRQYSADYTQRYDVASIFNRSLYFGGVLTFTHS